MKYTKIKIQTLPDKDKIQLLEFETGGGISSVKGSRYVKSVYNIAMSNLDAKSLYGWAKTQSSAYEKVKTDENVDLKAILNTEDDSFNA